MIETVSNNLLSLDHNLQFIDLYWKELILWTITILLVSSIIIILLYKKKTTKKLDFTLYHKEITKTTITSGSWGPPHRQKSGEHRVEDVIINIFILDSGKGLSNFEIPLIYQLDGLFIIEEEVYLDFLKIKKYLWTNYYITYQNTTYKLDEII